MILDLAVNAASGLWTVATKASLVSVLVPLARDALVPALVAFSLCWIGMRATLGTATTAELFADLAGMLLKVALIMAALFYWTDIAKTILNAAESIVGAIAPGNTSYRLVGNVMSYVTTVSDAQAGHALNSFTSLINGIFPTDPEVGDGSLLGLEMGGGPNPENNGLANLPEQGALFMQMGMAIMLNLGYLLLSMILAVMILVGCLIPMLMFTVAMVLGPLVLPAYLLDNQFARELTEGWQQMLMSSVVALVVLATLVALVLPMVPAPSTATATTGVDASKLSADGFQTLLFAAALLAMPQSIAHGLLTGRVPAPPSLVGFILGILKLMPKTRLLAKALTRK